MGTPNYNLKSKVRGNMLFEEFSKIFVEEYVKKELSSTTAASYISILSRVNPLIGNTPLKDVSAELITKALETISSPITVKHYSAVADITELYTNRNFSRNRFAVAVGVAPITISAACNGDSIADTTAISIAKTLQLPIELLFQVKEDVFCQSEKTIHNHLMVISAILSAAVTYKAIPCNPVDNVDKHLSVSPTADILTDNESRFFLRSLKSEPLKWRVIGTLLLRLGLTRGELLGLDWNDIDFSQNTLCSKKTARFADNDGVVEMHTKKTSDVFTLAPDEVSLLNELRLSQQAIKANNKDWKKTLQIKIDKDSPILIDNNFIFTQANGQIMHPDSTANWLKEFSVNCGIKKITPATLRNTCLCKRQYESARTLLQVS